MARREWAEQWVVHRSANPRSSEVPAYRYIATDGEYFIVEYCNQLKRLSKVNYELITNFEVVNAADAQATIAALQARVDNLEHQIAQRGGMVEIDDCRAKAELYDDLHAELGRVRNQYEGMLAMVAALPKVEGEIAVKETEIDLAVMWGITVNGLFGEHSPLFDTKEEADAYAALLQHRQGMEG